MSGRRAQFCESSSRLSSSLESIFRETESLSLVGLRAGEDGRGTDWPPRKSSLASSETLDWDPSTLVRWGKSSSLSSSKPSLGLGNPINHLGGE